MYMCIYIYIYICMHYSPAALMIVYSCLLYSLINIPTITMTIHIDIPTITITIHISIFMLAVFTYCMLTA